MRRQLGAGAIHWRISRQRGGSWGRLFADGSVLASGWLNGGQAAGIFISRNGGQTWSVQSDSCGNIAFSADGTKAILSTQPIQDWRGGVWPPAYLMVSIDTASNFIQPLLQPSLTAFSLRPMATKWAR